MAVGVRNGSEYYKEGVTIFLYRYIHMVSILIPGSPVTMILTQLLSSRAIELLCMVYDQEKPLRTPFNPLGQDSAPEPSNYISNA